MVLVFFLTHKGILKKAKLQENLIISLYVYFDNFYLQKKVIEIIHKNWRIYE